MNKAKGYRPTDWIDPRIQIKQSRIHGKGMFASSPIRRGEVVTIWGGTVLLTNDDLAGCISDWHSKGFVWATIGEGMYLAKQLAKQECDFTDYINHSCDPNVWMVDEVTLAARRGVSAGGELTIDYAMFEGDESWIPPWECRCGSSLCRGHFTGKDWRLKELQERYRDHFSPFINDRIRKLRILGREDREG